MNPPPVQGLLETVVYCASERLDDMRRFYSEVLGLRAVFDRHPLAFRLGNGLLLVFAADESSVQDDPPPHGATGSIHTCLVASPEAYEEWKTHLPKHDVEIQREIRWPGGRRSIYFSDPAGNLLEIADGDFWPR